MILRSPSPEWPSALRWCTAIRLPSVSARSKNRPESTLKVGTVADVTVLEQVEGRFRFIDSYRKERIGKTLLVAAATVLHGKLLPAGGGRRMRFPDTAH